MSFIARIPRRWPFRTSVRSVSSTSSMTPLAAAFNAKSLTKFGFKTYKEKSTGLFQIPGLTSPEGFGQLKEECIRNSMNLVDEAVSDNRSRPLVQVFDDLSDELCRVADMAEFIRLAHPVVSIAKAAEDASISISGLVETLNTHLRLYESLRRVVDQGDSVCSESEVDKHVAKLFLLDFQQCGIHLDEESRKMVVGLNDYILQIGQQFSAGTQIPVGVKKTVLPENVRHLFHIEGDTVILNGLHVDSPNDLAREIAYKIYYKHNDNQETLLNELVTHRHHLAELCEYPTFAHRAMTESLGRNPESVMDFLTKLATELKPILQDDYTTMLNMKKQRNPLSRSLELWDVPYYANIARQNWLNLDFAKISEYFSLGVCMEGLNMLYKSLFGVQLEVETAQPGELWHHDVCKMAVKEVNGGKLLGHIYCDFFTRQGKPYQDCHFTIRGGRLQADGHYQNPIVVLMLNLPTSSWSTPTLLNGSMIDNLFHEMGHAMHSMLARTQYQHVTGTRCSTDFAEVPSTLMEYFSSCPRVLAKIAKHYKTGESLPMDVLEKFCAAKKIFASTDIQTQLVYSLVDQKYHAKHPLGYSTTDVLKSVHQEHHLLPYPDGTAWQHRFSHLVGYGARYYSYLMARSVASSIWQKFFESDPFDSDSGAKYKNECLIHGGGKPSFNLVSDYLGTNNVGASDLAQALIDEVHSKNDALKTMLSHNP